MHRRTILYALLALAVPLPALALTGGDTPGPAPEANLAVSASVDSCGTAADTIVCKIDASWNDVPGTNRYTASVTRADGSVVDFGEVGAGGSSFWVPYAGDGTYTVSVSAYGTPPGETKPQVVARGSSSAGSRGSDATAAETAAGTGSEAGGALSSGDTPEAADPGGEVSQGDEPSDADPPEDPSCVEEPADEPAPDTAPGGDEEQSTEPNAAAGTEKQALSSDAEAELDESAELPGDVECPAASG